MNIFRRLKTFFGGSDGKRARNRAIERECATLRRWSERTRTGRI